MSIVSLCKGLHVNKKYTPSRGMIKKWELPTPAKGHSPPPASLGRHAKQWNGIETPLSAPKLFLF